MRLFSLPYLVALAWFSAACSAPKPSANLLAPSEAQTKLRAIQSRTFEL